MAERNFPNTQEIDEAYPEEMSEYACPVCLDTFPTKDDGRDGQDSILI